MFTDILTAVGVLITGIGLIYAGIQIRLSRKTTRSQFLLQVYELMEQHNEVHARLTGLGWPDGRVGPQTVEEWIKVGRLLGLFEYIQILIEDGLIDLKTVDQLYGYRLFYAYSNEVIRARHFNDDGRWNGVMKLLNGLKEQETFILLMRANEKKIDSGRIPNSSRGVSV
jgi:hypothetical protein